MYRYKKTRRNIHKTRSHIDFLEECVQEEYISMGFKLKWRPSYIASHHKKDQISDILNNTSLRLKSIVISHNTEKEKMLTKQIENLRKEAKHNMNEIQLSQNERVIDNSLESYVNTVYIPIDMHCASADPRVCLY